MIEGLPRGFWKNNDLLDMIFVDLGDHDFLKILEIYPKLSPNS